MGRRRVSRHRAAIYGLLLGALIALLAINTIFLVRILSDNTRSVVTGVLCDAIRDNAKLEDKQTGFYQGIIVNGAKGSIIFEPLYRQYHAPPYKQRVKQAEQQAAQAARDQAILPDCKALVRRVTHAR